MTDKLLNILEKLEDDTEKFIKEFESKLPGISDDLYSEIQSFLGDLKKSSTGSLAANTENLKKIDRFRVTLNGMLENGEYGDSVKDFVGEFKSNTGYIDTFYSTMVRGYRSNKQLAGLLYEQSYSMAVNTLLKSGMDANFTTPVIKIMKDHVISGAPIKEVNKALKDYLVANGEGKLVKYSKQVSSDAITQFNANYINLTASDLGLNHYYYKGTKVVDSRDLCKHLAGKYYKESELKTYINGKIASGGWPGMIKGTTWATFPQYRGGYHCRHYLIPVSVELYDEYKKR